MTDGFGRRVPATDGTSGDPVEHLVVAPALVSHTGFASALADRVGRLADVRHASYVRVRRLDRPAANALVVVSDATPGPRLSDLLELARKAEERPDIQAVVAVLRQLLPAVALFARHNRTQAIGTIAPERLFVTPPARVVVADVMLGPAVDQLSLSRPDAWRRYGVTSPPAEGPVVCSPRGDAMALGVVALSMLHGRMLADQEFPGSLSALAASARERHDGEDRPLSQAFARWLARALQIDTAQAFDSPHAAHIGFEEVLAADPRYVTRNAALEEWVARHGQAKEESPKGRVVTLPAPRPAGDGDGGTDQAGAGDRGVLMSWLPRIAAALAVVALLEAAVIGWLWTRPGRAAGEGDGELSIQSRPASARVIINGEDRGETPLVLTLPPGTHVMEVRAGDAPPRVIPLTIRAGSQTAQYVELQEPAPARR